MLYLSKYGAEDAHSPAQLISPPLCSHILYLSKYGAEDAHSPAQLISPPLCSSRYQPFVIYNYMYIIGQSWDYDCGLMTGLFVCISMTVLSWTCFVFDIILYILLLPWGICYVILELYYFVHTGSPMRYSLRNNHILSVCTKLCTPLI